MEIWFVIIPIITAGVFYLLWEGLKPSQSTVQAEYIIVVSAFLGLYCVYVSWMTSSGGLGVVFAFLCSIPVVFGAIVSTFIIIIKAPSKRKLIPLVVTLVFFAGLYVSYSSGEFASPESETMRNGVTIATAIEEYFRQNGVYPESLEQLVPQYLEAIPPIAVGDRRGLGRTDSWYYRSIEGVYWLGYFDSGQSFHHDGACIISSTSDTWTCSLFSDQDNPFR